MRIGAVLLGTGVLIGAGLSRLFRGRERRTSELPIGIGDSKAQREFLRNNKAFLREYPNLHTLITKVFIQALVISTQEQEIEQVSGHLELSDATAIAVEDRLLAQPTVFYLGRTAADDFGEIIILSGNGRGFGAYKILRGMYERVVTAAFIAQNPSEARHFLAHSDIEKGKLWKRLVEIMPDLAKRYTAEQIKDLEDRQQSAQENLKSDYCKKCNQPLTQEAWTRATLETMAQKVDPNLKVLYPTCYVMPTLHHHATPFGLETRLRQMPNGGYTFRETSEGEARQAVMLGHNLMLQLLNLQNSYFGLGLDNEIKTRCEAFIKIWDDYDSPSPLS
jgi:RNase P subunit RPR2